ncbi:hypothetical protein GCM10010215_73590 [Streptomyces virginiae]|uniref:Uncharacterized protein n=1 Tax=Streptomyces virginiae TaxID=1961 RepID=A0ABQ3NER1_STRVG|nr:hypothetical protein [Streptomyces virginiae]GGQ39232.1 hypothetical protein GCM10010215_73590 [Streptomyces virginiae]GHI11179.1 hypothetical protein Scinn_06420 [Streptomyces virginiae]
MRDRPDTERRWDCRETPSTSLIPPPQIDPTEATAQQTTGIHPGTDGGGWATTDRHRRGRGGEGAEHANPRTPLRLRFEVPVRA